MADIEVTWFIKDAIPQIETSWTGRSPYFFWSELK